ncbi:MULTISPECIES: CcmD family protein [unclassified Adlercreutzia]|uniref:CcmD family protein n=1 Tax=unclassified Adlercreutzia TaxID=2636013 RepID=UPI0013ECADC2|nr:MULTISPECIES: CcmD family protein [unclassified Adlercreutzia]
MNPVLEEIYSTIIPSAPYLIAAYALLWVALLVYILIIVRGQKRAEKQLELIEEDVKGRTL